MLQILAAFTFFTRLPLWRIHSVPAEYFKNVVNYWALTGWLTASAAAGMLWLSAQVLPLSVAILIGIATRLLLTGALHEDGLADFFDGFGGGTTREKILIIMKDSHIGSYGVLGLIFYFGLFYLLISSLPLHLACIAILVGDPYSKFCSAQIINRLPYARKEEDSKAKVIYNRMPLTAAIISLIAGALPLFIFLPTNFWSACTLPIFMFWFLISFMKKRLQGYTGDCCGAMFLLCELSFYLGIVILYYLHAPLS